MNQYEAWTTPNAQSTYQHSPLPLLFADNINTEVA